MAEYHVTELDNRISVAWRAFGKYKHVFCSKRICFKTKLRLFEATVTPAALYACESWTLTGEMARQLKSVWRSMVRKMFSQTKLPDEDWVAYVQRATHAAESLALKSGLRRWDCEYRTRKWNFAGDTARSDANKWSTRLLQWQPFFRCTPVRRVGRPATRWTDDLVKLAGGDWHNVAHDEALWASLSDGFGQHL